jgi:hypothetical protein
VTLCYCCTSFAFIVVGQFLDLSVADECFFVCGACCLSCASSFWYCCLQLASFSTKIYKLGMFTSLLNLFLFPVPRVACSLCFYVLLINGVNREIMFEYTQSRAHGMSKV